ncbi:MAG: RNA 3'-terminal phosphate cyclase [Methanobacterium sp.]|nr:RNA 3'-terminal phosphate cyclase [Methanobacterium sp.]
MIEIDGSYGEGGGALLRISAALSAITGRSIKVTNIRVRRPKPGLMPQHLTTLLSMAQLCQACHDGLRLGSTEIIFQPQEIVGGDYEVDIGTAGSVTLALQCLMIPAAFASTPVNLTLKGGTDVPWSPPVDYFIKVTLPILKSLGYESPAHLIQRGHYPRGGGVLKVEINPINKIKPFKLIDLEFDKIKGISHAVKLPRHVAERQAKKAAETLHENDLIADIEIQNSNRALGAGSGIVLWTEGKYRIGASALGKPGKRAELVGEEAAQELLYHLSRNAALDRYMGDQIIPYMALAGNSQVKTAELTQHTCTNIHVAEILTGKKFQVEGELGGSAIITVD